MASEADDAVFENCLRTCTNRGDSVKGFRKEDVIYICAAILKLCVIFITPATSDVLPCGRDSQNCQEKMMP